MFKKQKQKKRFILKPFFFKDLAKSETPPLPSSLAPMCIFLTHIKYLHVWDSDKKSLLYASVGFTEAVILAPYKLKIPKRLWWPCGDCGGFALPVSCFPLQQKELRWWKLFTELHFRQPPLMVEALLMACFSLPLPILRSLPELWQKLRRSVQQHMVDKMRPCISFHASAVRALIDGFKWSGLISFKNNDISNAFK